MNSREARAEADTNKQEMIQRRKQALELMAQYRPSIMYTKIIVSALIITLLVLEYLLPVVNKRVKTDIVTFASHFDYSEVFFVFGFLCIFLIVYYVVKGRKARNIVLYIASLIFLSLGDPYYLILCLISTGFTYIFGKSIYKDINQGREYQAGATMKFGVLLHIFILVVFGLSNSYIEGIKFIFNAGFSLKSVAIPVGLTAYTLHGISYLMDVYRGLNVGKVKYLDSALYMIMFPRLIIGPYASSFNLITQINTRKEKADMVGEGALRYLKGLIKKLFIADNVIYLFERVSSFKHSELSTLSAWLGAFALMFAIYFALSGYSDMACGLAKMLGFNFNENFKEPFRVHSIVELKDRFMVSTFAWLREYVYVPISMRITSYQSISMAGVFLCALIFCTLLGDGGRFFVGGLFFAAICAIEYSVRGPAVDKKKRHGKIYSKLLMAIGMVFFGSRNIVSALYYIKSMLFLNGRVIDSAGLYYLRTYAVIFILLVLISTPSLTRNILRRIRGGRK